MSAAVVLRRFLRLGWTCKEMYSIVVNHGLPLLADKCAAFTARVPPMADFTLGTEKVLLERVLKDPSSLNLQELKVSHAQAGDNRLSHVID